MKKSIISNASLNVFGLHDTINGYKKEGEMSEFQVRVSSETIYYFDELKKIYMNNDNTDVEITRSQILTRAFEETQSIVNWKIYIEDNKTISLKNLEYVNSSGTNVKVQIDDKIEKGIRSLKYIMPNFTGTRSVTLGVTVKLLLKTALILNKTDKVNINKSLSVDLQIKELKKNLENIVAIINHDLLDNVLNDFKNKINL